MSFLIFHVWIFCSASLLISTDCTQKGSRVLAWQRNVRGDKAGSKAAGLCLVLPSSPTVFMESTKMTRKRKRDSGPSETAPDATSMAQPAQVNESGSGAAPVEETGAEANMDLEVTDAQNNAHGTLSAAKKRSKPKRKSTQGRGPLAPKPKIVKLKPARPYPTVPTSSSATVPKSRRAEGRNKICVTRRTELGSYLRQCRNVLTKDGYVHAQT